MVSLEEDTSDGLCDSVTYGNKRVVSRHPARKPSGVILSSRLTTSVSLSYLEILSPAML